MGSSFRHRFRHWVGCCHCTRLSKPSGGYQLAVSTTPAKNSNKQDELLDLPPSYDTLLRCYDAPSKKFVAKLQQLSKDKTVLETALKDNAKEALELAPTILVVGNESQEMRDRAIQFAQILDQIDASLERMPNRLSDILLVRTELVRLQRAIAFGSDPGSKLHSRLARFLHNLAIALGKKQRFGEACVIDEEALAIHTECYRARPTEERAPHASMLWAYSVHLSAEGLSEEALAATDEELKIRRLLYESDPGEAMALSTTLRNRGIYLARLQRLEDARESKEEALVLRRMLYEQSPESYRTALLECLDTYITTLNDLDMPKEAGEARVERDEICL
ncbi:hypothetical protein DL93DRAFT_2172510 [Clavulina sp. PMI_390]|nr:hypothetical protein DL93DRAFT_2172510 [Clavulina sp. PMI_390]